MKITTLIENTAISDALEAEHGLSLFIETKEHRILFDMGQSGAFAKNAEKLGIDLAQADIAVLSHGHYDHGGGLPEFLRLNAQARVYVSRYAFGAYYNGTEKYIGLAKELQNEPRLVLTGDKTNLAEGLTLYSRNAAQRVEPLNPYGLNKRCGEDFLPDDFLHEQYLLIEEDGKRVLISGCSHKGIVNIAAWFEPDILVGGFHFMRLADEAALLRYADTLLTHPTKYYTGHCTGEEQYALLKARMGERLDALSTGKTIEL